MTIVFCLYVLKRFICISIQNKSKQNFLEMASCELNSFSLKFLITVLYLVEMLIFGGKRIANTVKHTFSHRHFHRMKMIASNSRNPLFLFWLCYCYSCWEPFFFFFYKNLQSGELHFK
jgi:hypothetical protein